MFLHTYDLTLPCPNVYDELMFAVLALKRISPTSYALLDTSTQNLSVRTIAAAMRHETVASCEGACAHSK